MKTGDNNSSRSLGRRALIKRAAIVGTAAWTAPVIVGSLASPAGAVTVPRGCYRMWVQMTAAGAAWPAWQSTAPDSCVPTVPGTCSPGNNTGASSALSFSPLTQPADGSGTAVMITASGGCTIYSASARVKTGFLGLDDVCRFRTTSGTDGTTTFTFTTTTVTIKPSGSFAQDTWDQNTTAHPRGNIGIVIQCP